MKKWILLLLVLVSLQPVLYAQLSGTLKIGTAASDDYNCLTCSTGVFKAMADSGVSGNLILEITSDLNNEDGSNRIPRWSAGFDVSIRPSDAVLKSVTYSGVGGVLLDLDSISDITIDGSFAGAGRYLRWISGQSAKPCIQINNDCKNVRVANCEVYSDNQSTTTFSGGAINLRSFGTVGNDNVSIDSNLIRPNQGKLYLGVGVSPPAVPGETLDSLSMMNNDFQNLTFRGIELFNGVGRTIHAELLNNSFYADTFAGSNDQKAMSFIYLNSGEGHEVDGNFFGGSASKSAGQKMRMHLDPNSNKFFVFRVGSGCSGAAPISFNSNSISNFELFGPTSTPLNWVGFKVHPSSDVPVHVGDSALVLPGNEFGRQTGVENITVAERMNSDLNHFRLIQMEGMKTQLAAGNTLGSVSFRDSTAKGLNLTLFEMSSAQMNFVVGNSLGLTLNTVYKSSAGAFTAIRCSGSSSINANRMAGWTLRGEFSPESHFIYVDPNGGSVNILENLMGYGNPFFFRSDATGGHHLYAVKVKSSMTSTVRVERNNFICVNLLSTDTNKAFHVTGFDIETATRDTLRIVDNYVEARLDASGFLKGIHVDSPNDVALIEGNTLTLGTQERFNRSLSGIEFKGRAGDANRVFINDNVMGPRPFPGPSGGIGINGGASGKSMTSFGIKVYEPNRYVEVKGNELTALSSQSLGREFPLIGIQVGNVLDSFRVEGNSIGYQRAIPSLSLNAHSDFESLMYIDVPDGVQKAVITANRFENAFFTGDNSDARIFGIRCTGGTNTPYVEISKNVFSGVNLSGTGDKRLTAIYCENGNSFISENTIGDLSINSSFVGDQFIGIKVDEANSSHRIDHNRIQNVILAQNQNATNHAVGIFFIGNNSTFDVNANHVSDFDLGMSDSIAHFQGIVAHSCKTANITNNVVLHTTATGTGSHQAYGIYDFANSGNINVYHNTVLIKADRSPTARGRTACYYKFNDATRVISNNIFVNASNAPGGEHYALFFASSSGAIGSDFNLLHSTSTPQKLVRFGVDYDIFGWRNKGFGIRSIAPPPQTFVDLNTGRQITSLGNDIGLTTLGVNADHVDSIRPLDNGYDLGAFEVPNSDLSPGVTSTNSLLLVRPNLLRVFPNPGTDFVAFQMEDNMERNWDYKVFNASGKLMLKGYARSGEQIDISELAPGQYFIQVEKWWEDRSEKTSFVKF